MKLSMFILYIMLVLYILGSDFLHPDTGKVSKDKEKRRKYMHALALSFLV